MTGLVNVLQTEWITGAAYLPDPSQVVGLKYTDLTPATEASVTKGFSAHATEVAFILAGGYAQGLIGNYYVMEAVAFMYSCLHGGRTLQPDASKWDLVNMSWGANDNAQLDIVAKLKIQIERDNVLAIGSPADAGDPVYFVPGSLQSPNFLRVASSTTGSVVGPGQQPDIYGPVAWNSFEDPTVDETAIMMISVCKGDGIAWKASDLKKIIIASAVADTLGRPIHNHDNCMKNLAAFYASALLISPTLTLMASTSLTPGSTAVIVQLTASAQGTQPFLYSWQKDGKPLAGQTGAALVLSNIQPTDQGVYVATVSNPAGQASAAPVTVLVNGAPPLPTPTPTPTPVPTPIPTPTPTPIPPTPTPSPVPTPTPAPSTLKIKSFTSTAYWVNPPPGPSNILSWVVTGGNGTVTVTLTDPESHSIPVGLTGSISLTQAEQTKDQWTLKAVDSTGVTVSATLGARGSMTAAQQAGHLP